MDLNKKSRTIILAVICLVYILLRWWDLTGSCLWFDEIFSIHAAALSLENLFWFVAQDLIHPPLFYVLLKAWIAIGGESLLWVRFFPVLFSIIALIPFLLLCRELKLSFQTTALALTFLAVNGSLLKYSQEVRMYSVLLCFALFSMWFFVRFLNLGKNFWILTFINILLIYTHYFGWLVVLTEILVILIFQRIKLRQIFIMFGLNALCFLPWMAAVWQAAQINSDFSQNLGWANRPNLQIISQFLFDLLEPFYFQQSSLEYSSVFFITIPLLLILLTAFGFYFSNWNDLADEEKRSFFLLLIFALTPVLLAYTASWVMPFSVWGTRHLIFVFAPFSIIFALAFNKINVALIRTAALFLIFLLIGLAFFLQTQRPVQKYIWCAWEEFALRLKNLDKPEKIYVFEDLVAYHFWFALRDSDRKFQIIAVKGLEDLKEDTAYFLPRGFDEVQKINGNEIEGDRFWIAFRETEWNEYKAPLYHFIQKGYHVGEPQIIEFPDGSKAFLVHVEKGES